MNVYIVARMVGIAGGYAHEDPPAISVICVLTDPAKAAKVARVMNANYFSVPFDNIPPVAIQNARQLGVDQ